MATTTDHTIHTAKASSQGGDRDIEVAPRDAFALRLPESGIFGPPLREAMSIAAVFTWLQKPCPDHVRHSADRDTTGVTGF
ncbi:hypothetical protein [Qipengyuania gaetbuli]|uniref:hypothetical protein n=1 Tax=Qipengyuania gaetbuli TaxID=266952 RepID=UPI0028F723EB|nr:hypothetical protein [Qipengyuania gaetbuli]